MNSLEVWFITFMTPIILLLLFTHRDRKLVIGSWKQNLIIVGAVFLSAMLALMFLYGQNQHFSFIPNRVSLLLVVAASLVSLLLVHKFAFFYIISSFIQELCLLANAQLLFSGLNIWFALILIVPLYAIAHLQTLDKWKFKMIVTSVWGVISIVIFWLLHDIYLNTAFHLIMGAILTQKGILFTKTRIHR